MREFKGAILRLPQALDTGLFEPSPARTRVLELGPQAQRVLADIECQLGRIADAVAGQDPLGLGSPRATYSVKEAARMLGRSESTVRRWISEGKLDSAKSADTQQGRHMIPLASLRKYLGSG